MKEKKYLSKEDAKNMGADYCDMFYCKDENGYYDTIWNESETQIKIRLQGEVIARQINNLEYQLRCLKNKYAILQSEYEEEDRQFINL